MKVGLSLSRCILDIVENRVPAYDVLVIVARTDFDPGIDQQWESIWRGYTIGGASRAEWGNYAYDNQDHNDKFRNVAIDLWQAGKIHQPRKFGINLMRYQWHWLETMLPSSELETRPAVKDAWEQFKLVAELSGFKYNQEH